MERSPAEVHELVPGGEWTEDFLGRHKLAGETCPSRATIYLEWLFVLLIIQVWVLLTLSLPWCICSRHW